MVNLCNLCPKTFTQSFHLKEHLRIHTGEKPYFCEICKKSFIQKGYFDIHLRRHKGERPYACKYCQASFSDSGSRNRHMKKHTDEDVKQKPYLCSYCPKSFRLTDYLKIHMRIHTGEKPYLCSECTRTFSNKGNLTKHMETHNALRTVLCHICTKSFAQERYLKAHFLSVHKGETFERSFKRPKLYLQENKINYDADNMGKNIDKGNNYDGIVLKSTENEQTSINNEPKIFENYLNIDQHFDYETENIDKKVDDMDMRLNIVKSKIDKMDENNTEKNESFDEQLENYQNEILQLEQLINLKNLQVKENNKNKMVGLESSSPKENFQNEILQLEQSRHLDNNQLKENSKYELFDNGESVPPKKNSQYESIQLVNSIESDKPKQGSSLESNELNDKIQLVNSIENNQQKEDDKIRMKDRDINTPVIDNCQTETLESQTVSTSLKEESKASVKYENIQNNYNPNDVSQKDINPIKKDLVHISENMYTYGKSKIKKVDKPKSIKNEIIDSISQKEETTKISDKTEFVYDRYNYRKVQKRDQHSVENKLLYKDENLYTYGKCKIKKIEINKNEIKDGSIKKETLEAKEAFGDRLTDAAIKQEAKTTDCPLCSYKKISKDFYSQHMMSAHKKCEDCGYQSINKTDLKNHIEREHHKKIINDLASGMDMKTYRCNYCTESYEQHGLLLQHHLLMHNGKKWGIR